MNLPHHAVLLLNCGREVAAELPAQEPMRSFVMILPQVPNDHKRPELWSDRAFPPRVLRDPASITGYEIRLVLHDQKYTDTDWGWDYDYVLMDPTTRIKRFFVQKQEDIGAVLVDWLPDFATLRHVVDFDSSLLNSPINFYLEKPSEGSDEFGHLWREE